MCRCTDNAVTYLRTRLMTRLIVCRFTCPGEMSVFGRPCNSATSSATMQHYMQLCGKQLNCRHVTVTVLYSTLAMMGQRTVCGRRSRFTTHRITCYAPVPVGEAGALGGHRRPSSVRPSVRLSVRLMSRTSALTRKPKGLGRRNFAQGCPRLHATPTPTSRSKGQKSRSAGAGAYCGGHLAAQLVYFTFDQ